MEVREAIFKRRTYPESSSPKTDSTMRATDLMEVERSALALDKV